MPALVRTPIQHESEATRTPLLTSSQTLASQTQDYRRTPLSQPRCTSKTSLVIFVKNVRSFPKIIPLSFLKFWDMNIQACLE